MVRKARGKEFVEPVPVGTAGTPTKAAQVIDDSLDGSMLGTGDEGNSLFASVKKGRAALQSVVDEWIESYRQDRNTATLELLQFFSLASGCKGKITPQMKETMDNGRIIRELVEEFDDQAGGDYPIITNGPQWKKFRSNFCEFVHTLIRQCQYSIIYDQYLMENMISFLITLSDSQVRAFRHTATLAAMKLMTALVDVALTLSINIDNTQRQLDKARMEKSRGDKLDGLVVKRQELDDNMDDIKSMLGYTFKSIFVHRYRDIIPEIRVLCMYEIGIWMKKFPNYFLVDSFLKYVGWTLHDKVGDVRLKCLQSLAPLYETEETARKLELFTHKSKDRIVAMTLDKEHEVAVQAIKLIISIHKYHQEVLTDKDCEHVYVLVYASNRSVAQAAGEFLIEKLFQVNESLNSTLHSRRGKKLSVYTPQLRDLITFFIESEIHEHCAYLVDSLIENHPMMKDWECMTDLLLEEPSPRDESLGEKQESVLIDLMSCAVKQTASGEPPFDRIVKKSKLSAKDVASLNEEKERISTHFVAVIPDLLRKYKTDTDKIVNLLEIPLHFTKDAYSQNSDEIERLLAVLCELIEIHSDTEVIGSCARIFDFMQEDNFTHYRLVRVEVSTLLDSLLERYKKALNCLCEGADDEIETICFTTKKIVPLVACCRQMDTLVIWNLFFENWIKGFERIEDSNTFIDETIKYSISVCYYALIWELHTLSEARNQGPVDHFTRNRLIEFIAELRDLLTHPNEDLAQEAYFSICDLLLMFDHQLENDSPAVAQLVYRPNNTLIKQLESFIVERVFVYDEESEDEPGIQNSVERLHKKRHLLAGYCKLIIYNVIPMRHAICVIRHYVRFFNDFGDIIKTTLGKLREMNKVICAKTMASALIQVFRELQIEAHQNPNAFTKQDENFLALKELAKRFALSFGLDNQKNRDAVASLHREGIHFSFEKLDNPIDPLGPPPNLPFLEILSEFSNKLIKQDKKTVLLYLDKCVQSALPGIHNDEWQPLMSYRSSLTQASEFDISLNRTPARKLRARKRKRYYDDDDEGEDSQIGHESGALSEIAE